MPSKRNLRVGAITTGLITRVAGLLAAVSAVELAGAQSSVPQIPTPASSESSSLSVSGFDDYATGGWWGERQHLEQAGLSFNAQLVLEGFENFRGGRHTGPAGASTFDLNLGLDTEKAFNWRGGKFYVDLQDHAGRNPSADLTGDLQTFDKLNASAYLQVFELWYQQELFDGTLRLKLGKIDANLEFSVIDNGLPFLDASTQVTPTIIAFPTTPDPMPGACLFFAPGKRWSASFGTFYANQSDTFGDLTGHPQAIQPTESGVLFIGETGLRWQHALLFGADGNLKVGAWGHTGTFPRLDGGQQKGAHGYYAVLDQTLWQPTGAAEHNQGVRTFLESGRTQSSVSAIDWNVAGGITWTGPASARPEDVLGFSANWAHLSLQARLPHSYELALEWLYQAQLTKWATLAPDVQFIIHPGGQYPNAVVGTLDFTIQL